MDFNENKPIYKQIVDLCYARIVSDVWQGIIYSKRGLGYYVSPDAPALILEARRAEFFRETLPDLRDRMRLLQLTLDDIAPYLS